MPGTIEIRPLTLADVTFGMTLKDIAGWNQLPVDWERLIALEPDGCFVAQYDGQNAGTATAIAYGKLFGWIGMVLVHPQMRRKGLGTALLMHSIGYLEALGVQAVKLDATPAGKQLYDTIGFVDEYLLERRQGEGVAAEVTGVEPLTPALLDAICRFDAPIFGADRSRVLRRLSAEAGAQAGVILSRSGEVAGYVMLREGVNCHYIGPWIADEPAVGERLLRWAMGRIPGQAFFVDVCLANPHVENLVPRSLFPTQRQLIRMYRGTNSSPGYPQAVYGICGPEMG